MDSKLTTTNNREASLHIGEIIPYTVQQYNMGSNASGGGANLTVEKERVGVLITMTPHVNEENQITLNLAPEVSNITGWKGQFGDMPLVRTRKTNTTIRVEDGQKIFLAGLLSEEETFTTFKVPVLGEIPIVGMLFQNRRKDVIRKNLIIEVVPRIIRDPREIKKILEEDSVEKREETGYNGQTQPQQQTTQPVTGENDAAGNR
jgi:general secretion pathway protein D